MPRGRGPEPLVHVIALSTTDDVLRAEANAHLVAHPELQVVAEVLIRLRVMALAWWTPEQLRARWGAPVRLGWFAQRADLRQEITTALTGLVAKTARAKSPAFQAELIDAVIQSRDIDVQQFEGAFDPRDLVVYGPVAELWGELMARIPWTRGDDDVPVRLIESLLESLVADKSPVFGIARAPALTPWDLRAAIDPLVWSQLPLDARVAVEEARLRHEQSGALYPRDEVLAATLRSIAAEIPRDALRAVLVAAGRAMGLEGPAHSDVAPSARAGAAR